MKQMWQSGSDYLPKMPTPKQTSRAVEASCKHGELISYKVHQEQFKSLLVPPTVRLKLYKEPIKREESSATLSLRDSSDADGSTQNDSPNGSECMSTDGDESDPNSPLYPDSKYIN